MASPFSLAPTWVDEGDERVAAEAARIAAAERMRRAVKPPMRMPGAQSTDWNPRQESGATTLPEDLLIPKSPLDVAIMAAGGPFGKVAKLGALAVGAALMPSGAQAGPVSKLISGIGKNAPDVMRPSGIRAYHGSPHDFERFDMNRIGTGEGAQSYGHGLYFAENPSVADSYKNMYVPNNTIAGRLGFAPAMVQDKSIKGQIYEVNINAKPEEFLDLDRPLAQMGSAVRDRLANARLAHPEAHAGQSGGQIYESARIVPGEYRDPLAVSKTFRDAGIPGIKYLDRGSRPAGGANVQNPTSNYVLFDDSLVDIMRKYSLPGMVGAGGFGSFAPGGDQ